jgi:hypothetical protein
MLKQVGFLPCQKVMMKYNGKLIIYTQFYKFQTIEPYTESLLITALVLKEMGINFDYWPMANESHMERGINENLTRFADDDEATDFLNIDSDESWSPESVIRMITHPEPIVCGVYKMTGEYNKYTGVLETGPDGLFVGKLLNEDNAILQAKKIPAGFMRIKKEVVQKYITTYPDDYFMCEDRKAYRFFWNDFVDHQFVGMDYAFSEKLKALGYDLWVDPNCDISHWGLTEYKGNLDKYLRERIAIKEVAEVAEDIEKNHAMV